MKDKPVIEVFSNDIISGQFNTHGVAIEKDKDPCPVICYSMPQYLNIIQIGGEEHQSAYSV